MTALTTTDAFFVAYQEQAKVLMHFGAEVEVTGVIARATVEAAVANVVRRWPALGRTLERCFGGLRWTGAPARVLHESTEVADIERARNTPIDPFVDAPFGVWWVRRGAELQTFAVRCHHAVADGQLFFAVLTNLLAAIAADAQIATPPTGTAPHPLGLARLWRDTKIVPSVRQARRLAVEARDDRSARLKLGEVTPGPVAISDHRLDQRARGELFFRASAERVRPPWMVAAAWLQALHAWNAKREASGAVFSLEVPVSLRRGAHAMTGTGNHLAVLTLFADARLPLGELARGLWRDYADGVRRRDHLAIPLLAHPVRFLPWPVFRRVAVTSTSTGFASTHYTWLAHEPDVRAAVRDQSAGALRISGQRLYTPVCLRMGVALCVLGWPDELQLAITHRLSGLTADDAHELGQLLLAKLRH